MISRLKSVHLPLLVVAFSAVGWVAGAAPADSRVALTKQAIGKGLAYLRSTQEKDGSWSEYPATTALAVSAFVRNGRTEVNEPAVARAVQFILRSARPDGAIYAADNPATALPNYNTAICIMALAQTRNPSYRPVIAKAQQYLEKIQFDEEAGITPADPKYGGFGYGEQQGRQSNPDMSNLQTALEGLHESGTPATAPVFKKALIFLQRVQNRRESNDQAWAKDGSDDGGFVYRANGQTMSSEGSHASYGSMTYAGLKSYIYAGVSRTDPRAAAAFNWIRGHYTVSEHPGMGDTSLYYYYDTMAKTLDVYGQKVIRDTSGHPHDWSHDLATAIIAKQHPDGSWYNTNSRYWENQPGLVTSYSLIALSYCAKN